MIKLFRDGKALPKRYVWEIALGAYSVFEKEPSLVGLTLESGKSVDVIGDVHGMHFVCSVPARELVAHSPFTRSIL
jgi:serine/threonine-protein phosphatase 5